jgi:hypothetical protein
VNPAGKVFLGGVDFTGGESVAIHVLAGSAFVYGTITDNRTNAPNIEFARPVR